MALESTSLHMMPIETLFHINVPVPAENHEKQVRIAGMVVSLDPGIRTFMTCYDDPQGHVVERRNKDFNQIIRLCRYSI
ncbi:19894_t:CDS:2 [Gigaspora margarita]|uniref:19894_t:CDS:1 n=1 Tax=Gigaspora margarita TaxID=4874 RepID=A0ABN7UL60_GIGMA|nr:19894_t:CDS:2 [Gigaspora margarita]